MNREGTMATLGDVLAAALEDAKPRRIQRKRTKGWRMPPNTVSVTRPGPWGNPFVVGGYYKIGRGEGHSGFAWLRAHKDVADASFNLIETRDQAVGFFVLYRRLYPFKAEEIAELRGKNLACFCPLDQPCHADVLLELANADSD